MIPSQTFRFPLRAAQKAGQLLASEWRLLSLRVLFPGFRASGRNYIGPGCEIYLHRGSGINLRGCHVSRGVTLTAGRGASLDLNQVYIGQYSTIVARERVVVGCGTQIAESVSIRDANHDHSAPLTEGRFVSSPIDIGGDVWIGAGAAILAGVALGDRVTVGANAVVTRTALSGTTVIGVPALPLQARRGPNGD